MKQRAIDHMNKDHVEVLISVYKKFGNANADTTNIKMTDMNENGIEITCNDDVIFVPFITKVEDHDGYKDAIIELYASVKEDSSTSKVQKNMVEFMDSFKTLVISSIKDGQPVSSYSPFVKEGDAFYICISSVAKHYHAIKQNPNNISVFFIQDEKEAKSLFARVRVSLNVVAEFVDDAKRADIMDKFEKLNPNESALSFIKTMKDFYVVKLTPKTGRYVKGFGAAYDIEGLKIANEERVNNPHIKQH
ncbi:HugZ family heme oxygenase [Campylobacter pinnipediorum]|nr:HugZ family heme oxygenase [Campylobacter pinnipediorum]AQW80588.1 iron-responsive cellular heme oxygenase [Campylobacter pinnipediorum subsp. pinnipediorum]AQW82256.1 iron-responsive cellular heme oxygenase [Campylobacter pinnipediorum subsp. pinnipediorum]